MYSVPEKAPLRMVPIAPLLKNLQGSPPKSYRTKSLLKEALNTLTCHPYAPYSLIPDRPYTCPGTAAPPHAFAHRMRVPSIFTCRHSPLLEGLELKSLFA